MSDHPGLKLSLEPIEPAPTKSAALDPWGAQTELATQFMPRGDEKSDLSTPVDQTIGKAVGERQWELFVSCVPADALAQQFDIRLPTFMALHALGALSSKAFLADVATHLNVPLQQLVIRRQGFGTTLAIVFFVEAQGANGEPIRIYACETEGDASAREDLSRLLLSRAKLSAVLIEGASPTGLKPQMDLLESQAPRALRAGSAMHLVPVGPAPELEALRASLALRLGTALRACAPVPHSLQAWPVLTQAWNALLLSLHPGVDAQALPTFAQRSVEPTAVPSVPAGPSVSPWQAASQALVTRYGVHACCMFNAKSLAILGHAGPDQPGPSLMARQGRTLLAAVASSGQLLGLGKAVQEAQITLQDRVMLVWQLPAPQAVDSEILLVLWMPLSQQNSWPAIKVALTRLLVKA